MSSGVEFGCWPSYYAEDLVPADSIWSKKETEVLCTIMSRFEGTAVDWSVVCSELNSRVGAGNRKAPRECFIMYRNNLDPRINKNPWTKKEDADLLKLAEKYNGHEWALISSSLGTNRTPFDCLQRYQVGFLFISNYFCVIV